MEKLVVEAAENVFNDIPGFPYRRRTLPEKIIRLRKISQEHHVRRMKSASRKKHVQAMQGTTNLSMTFSSSASSINNTISSPNAGINYRNAGSFFDEPKNENISSKVNGFSRTIQNSNDRKKDCHSRFTNVNRLIKTEYFSGGNSAVMSDTALDICCRKKSMIHPNCKINKMYSSAENDKKPDKTPDVEDGKKMSDENEGIYDKNQKNSDAYLRGNTLSKGNWRPFDSIMDSIHLNRLKMKKEKSCKDSPNRSLENLHFKDLISTEVEIKSSNASKIPILRTRLSSEKKNKDKQSLPMTRVRESNVKNTENKRPSLKASNVNGCVENTQAKALKDGKRTPESFLNECISRDFESTPGKNSFNASGLNSKSKEELSQTLHSVSRWLQDSVTKADKNNKSSNVSQAESLVEDIKRSMENLSLKNTVTPKTNVFKTTSSLTYSVRVSCSGSDESLDYFYETKTGDEVVKNISSDEDQNVWEEDSDEDSISLAADMEDKIIGTPENYAKSKYYDYPDYPKTPYDLRYPRYYKRENNGSVTKIEEYSTQTKTPKKKIRKKSRTSTPKIKKSKKSKGNLSHKKQLSKNKKA